MFFALAILPIILVIAVLAFVSGWAFSARRATSKTLARDSKLAMQTARHMALVSRSEQYEKAVKLATATPAKSAAGTILGYRAIARD